MRAQVEYCNDLVRTTMNFLRQSPAGHAPFALNTVMNLCLEVARPQLMSLNVAVAAEFEADLPQALGDMVLVRQAVLNLIYNACQAMEAQETPRQLRLQTYRTAEWLCIAVQDNGPGIPEGETEIIFEALYTTKGSQGTGLGLAVVKNVMERHGGRARFEKHSGRGARFVLEFPIPASNK
jgi:signal transduction histidine kinase